MSGININFQKKDLFLLSAIIVFLVGVGFVVAYGGNQPTVMGHSYNEIQTCGAVNQTLVTNLSGSWQCVNISKLGSGPSPGWPGMYMECCPASGACITANPATSACSCPAGTTPRSISSFSASVCTGAPCGGGTVIKFCY